MLKKQKLVGKFGLIHKNLLGTNWIDLFVYDLKNIIYHDIIYFRFNPERFLSPTGKLIKHEHFVPFGVGENI